MTPLLWRVAPYVLAGIVAVGWLRARDARIRAEERAALVTAQADSLAAAWQADSAARAEADAAHQRQDSLAAGELARRVGRLTEARAAASRALAARDSLAARLAVGPDTAALAGLLAITDTLRVEGETCGLALAACDSLATARDARVLDLEGRVAEADRLIASQADALARLRRLAQPGVLGRLERGLPYLAAGLVLGVLIR